MAQANDLPPQGPSPGGHTRFSRSMGTQSAVWLPAVALRRLWTCSPPAWPEADRLHLVVAGEGDQRVHVVRSLVRRCIGHGPAAHAAARFGDGLVLVGLEPRLHPGQDRAEVL